jgi:PQQ-like domain
MRRTSGFAVVWALAGCTAAAAPPIGGNGSGNSGSGVAGPHAPTVALRATPGSEVVTADDEGGVTLWHGDGRVGWHSKLLAAIVSPPEIARNGNIFVRTASGLTVLDGRGTTRWSVPTPPPPPGQWAGVTSRADSSVLFLDATGALVCYSPTGTRHWRWPPTKAIEVAPATAPDSSTFVRDGGMLVRLGVDGTAEWSK